MSPLLTFYIFSSFILFQVQSILNSEDYLKQKLITRNDTLKWLKSLETKNTSSPYCEICCVKISKNIVGKICGSHTMCRYSNNTIGASCRGYINVGFSLEEKNAILDVHNSLRSKVAQGLETVGKPGPQPPASNMRIMNWNEELSQIAQRWVAQCIFSHDLCRDTINYPVGQNLGKGNLATDNELSLIVKWYEEVRYFNNNDISNFKLVDNGESTFERYTQIIWADTNMLGCARAIFQQSLGVKLSYVEHLVCNYGPTGNIPDQPVYNIGRPCSTCSEGMGCSLEYEGLCEESERVNLVSELNNMGLKLKISFGLSFIVIYMVIISIFF